MSDILLNEEIRNKIFSEVKNIKTELLVVSAYCKKNVVAELDKLVANTVKSKKLLARCQLCDFTSGATDVDLYTECRRLGWDMYFYLDLHAKTYVFDKKRCIIGSANATNKGLSFVQKSNAELAVVHTLTEDDYEKIEMLFDESVLMNDRIFETMNAQMKDVALTKGNLGGWDQEITKLFEKEIKSLFSQDFPDTKEVRFGYYYEFIDDVCQNEGDALVKFKKARCYKWLKGVLERKETKEIYFGELSSMIHNVLVSDPPAYRVDVKNMLKNLLNWIDVLNDSEILIDRPNYSQRIFLKR